MISSSHSNSLYQPYNLGQMIQQDRNSVLFSAISPVSRTVPSAHSKCATNICWINKWKNLTIWPHFLICKIYIKVCTSTEQNKWDRSCDSVLKSIKRYIHHKCWYIFTIYRYFWMYTGLRFSVFLHTSLDLMKKGKCLYQESNRN